MFLISWKIETELAQKSVNMRRISSAPLNTAWSVWTVMTQSSAKWDRIASTSFESTALKYESGRAASCSLDSRAVCVATCASLAWGRESNPVRRDGLIDPLETSTLDKLARRS